MRDKRTWILPLLLLVLLLPACASEADWEARLEPATPLVAMQDTELIMSIFAQGQPVTGLSIHAQLEMKRMDHGVVEVTFQEKGNGQYTATARLPMGGEWEAIATIFDGKHSKEQSFLLTCAQKQHTSQKPQADGRVATINGEAITEQDLAFHALLGQLQIERKRKLDQQRLRGAELEQAMQYWEQIEQAVVDKNSLLTTIIRLRAAELLAKEKGYAATQQEVKQALEKEGFPAADDPALHEHIKAYGASAFHDKQQSYGEGLVLQEKIRQDMLDAAKAEHPQASSQELQYVADKKYEELLASQIDSLQIEFENSPHFQ